MLTRIITALSLAVAHVLNPHEAGAQPTGRIQVALVASLSSPDARAELVRFSDQRPDIILLRAATATEDDLLVALLSQEQIRIDRPTRPGLSARTTFVNSGPLPDVPAGARKRASEMLKAVRNSPEARIGNLGRGRWSEFDVR
jgi:hypothetical protein